MAEGGEIESLQLETKQLTVRAPARRRPEGAPQVAAPREGARAPPPPASSPAGPRGLGGEASPPTPPPSSTTPRPPPTGTPRPPARSRWGGRRGQPSGPGGGLTDCAGGQELQESRNELLGRVQTLKKDLHDWRSKLDDQVKNYRSELGDLKQTLHSEVDQLRNEFQELRRTLREQLETTASLAAVEAAPDDVVDRGN